MLTGFDYQDENQLNEVTAQVYSYFPTVTHAHLDVLIADAQSAFVLADHSGDISNDGLVGAYYDSLSNIISRSTTVSILQGNLNTLKGLVSTNLTCSDRDFLLTCISVASRSAYLWAPTTIGGQGYYDAVIAAKGLNGKASARFDWKNVLGADIAGAAGEFFKYGLGLSTPGANVAIATDIAVGAAISSVIAGIGL